MNKTPPGLRVTNLTKDFGGLRAIDSISFQIEKGEFAGLIGPNGCGKSTSFNCISGLVPSTSGTVEVLGKDATGMRPDQVQKIGLTRTFQHTRLWKEMTVIENLLVPPRQQFAPNLMLALLRPGSRFQEKQRINRAYEILDLLEITHIAHSIAGELSGGQSKLVDIGRALMSSPKFLLLDEPVAGVAGPLAERIFQNLKALSAEKNMGMLIIEHNMGFILRRDVDRIIVMDRGTVLLEGPPDVIRKSKDVVEAYLGDSGAN